MEDAEGEATQGAVRPGIPASCAVGRPWSPGRSGSTGSGTRSRPQRARDSGLGVRGLIDAVPCRVGRTRSTTRPDDRPHGVVASDRVSPAVLRSTVFVSRVRPHRSGRDAFGPTPVPRSIGCPLPMAESSDRSVAGQRPSTSSSASASVRSARQWRWRVRSPGARPVSTGPAVADLMLSSENSPRPARKHPTAVGGGQA